MSEQALVEVNNENVPTGPQEKAIYEFRKAELEKFMVMSSEFPTIINTVKGEMCIIDGVEFPVNNKLFNAKIVQGGHLNKEPELEPHKGKIFIEHINRSYDQLELLPIGNFSRTRSYFETAYKMNSGAKPSCYSNNGIYPSPRATSPVCHKCVDVEYVNGQVRLKDYCEFSKFTGTKENKEKPRCSEVIGAGFLVLNLKTAPIKIAFKGRGITIYKQLMQEYLDAKRGGVYVDEDIFDKYIVMTVENKQNWYEPKFRWVTDSERNLSKFLPLINHYAVQAMKEEERRIAKEEAEAAANEAATTIDSKIAAELAAAGNTEVEFVV